MTGPPGAGKTALVASWIARARSKTVWLQVDRGDADPAAFFFWLRAAAWRVVRARLPAFGPEYLADPCAFARQFARVLFSTVQGTVLVLDDCSEVNVDAPLHGILREMCAEIPAGCGAIVTSRSDPSPGLARLRARGTLEIVDAEALALTSSEVAAVAKLRGGRSLPATTLIARTQGWAAGVALLAAGARGDDVRGSPSAGVFDFLAAEVLDRAPRQVQNVLLRVSLAPRPSRPARDCRGRCPVTR